MSKTIGNVIDPNDLINKYGADALRYYLLAKFSPFLDGDFSEEKLKDVYNGELASGLGNTVSRIAKLAETSGLEFGKTKFPKEIYTKEQKEAFEQYRFDAVLQNSWATDLHAIDAHVDQNAPWTIKDKNKLKRVLQEEIDDIRRLAISLKPFLPETAEAIGKQFSGPKIKSEKPLFPRL
jgi:methionyl-tRNA synthetase